MNRITQTYLIDTTIIRFLLVGVVYFFSFASEGIPCLHCSNSIKDEKLRHILDNHHEFPDTCFFCDEPHQLDENSKKSTSVKYRYGSHLKEKHPELLLGLYLYYFSFEPSRHTLKKWNPYHFHNQFSSNSLYTQECQCNLCGATMRALAAPYHFVNEVWGRANACSVCKISLKCSWRKRFITFDVLKAIKHARACCFDIFNESFMKVFPGLRLQQDNKNLVLVNSITPRATLLSLHQTENNTVNPTQIRDGYSCKICFSSFSSYEDTLNHVLTESIAMHHNRCKYCLFKISKEDFQDHLLRYHIASLCDETQKIELLF